MEIDKDIIEECSGLSKKKNLEDLITKEVDETPISTQYCFFEKKLNIRDF